jgi:hypothetical protein
MVILLILFYSALLHSSEAFLWCKFDKEGMGRRTDSVESSVKPKGNRVGFLLPHHRTRSMKPGKEIENANTILMQPNSYE